MERLENARKELEDSFIVLMHIETRAAQALRQHSEWLANQDERISKHDAEIAESNARLKHIETGLAEATDKLNSLIDRDAA